jgi:hypothetical protein
MANWKDRIIKVEDVPVEELYEAKHPMNWREHPRSQQLAIKELIEDVGVVQSVMRNETTGNVIDGHLRIDTAYEAGMRKETLKTTWVKLTEEEEYKVLMLFDPIGAMATTDYQQVDRLIGSFSTDKDALNKIISSFEHDAERILKEEARGQREKVDHTEQYAEDWPTKRGQIWEIPSIENPEVVHRVMCGDSGDPELVKKLIGKHQPILMVTDPPYGRNYDNTYINESQPYGSHTRNVGAVENDDIWDWTEVYKLWNANVMYVWHAGLMADLVLSSLRELKYEPRALIIWDKTGSGPYGIRGNYHWTHEQIWYVVKKGKKANWARPKPDETMWREKSLSSANKDKDPLDSFAGSHPAQKPVSLYQRAILNNSYRGQSVMDPFAGSGTCFAAAESLGRRFVGSEWLEKYASTILARAASMGLEPRLVHDE